MQDAARVYLACEMNEELTANLLLDSQDQVPMCGGTLRILRRRGTLLHIQHFSGVGRQWRHALVSRQEDVLKRGSSDTSKG